ncbi:hypothetical protein [Azospirillum brasilense]|nr:hypothetical protein [Azospirillum brasilense]
MPKKKKAKGDRAVWSPANITASADQSTDDSRPLIPLTIRLTEEQYRRVQELKLATPGKRRRMSSVQELTIEGLSRLLAERGLPPL